MGTADVGPSTLFRTFAKDFAVQPKGCSISFHCSPTREGRCTDDGEIVSTTRSRISARANSAQVQVGSERASSSGSSHASLTRYIATIGGDLHLSVGSRHDQRGQASLITNLRGAVL